MKTQKDLIMAWAKIELISSYGYPPIPVIPMEYNENKSLLITEEGKKNLKLIQQILKQYENFTEKI